MKLRCPVNTRSLYARSHISIGKESFALKINHSPNNKEVRLRRKDEYLKAWPIEKQLEALAEAAAGRSEKLTAMTAEFDAIRLKLPFSGE